MARLRIRIELNRGGVGVPLHKLASVVEEAQKFFYLLAEDIHVDQTQGDWLGFDFGNESLNFTAEFVGPVTAEQVAAFHAAFDGTTSLRRATIAQFARITESIEQDELIGFGLYMQDDGNEPTEWRCLSRRDALRITEEIQLLIQASGEGGSESHLPVVTNTGAGARLFSDRRERGLESAKWAAYVREVEANMDRRLSRVENVIEGQGSLIEDLHVKSTATEDSVRKLLTAVEGFCAQTTRQLEAISAPAPAQLSAAQIPEVAVPEVVMQEATLPEVTLTEAALPESAHAAAAAASEPAIVNATSVPVSEPSAIPTPVVEISKEPEPIAARVATPPAPQAVPPTASAWQAAVKPAPEPKRDWRFAAGFVLAGLGVVILVTWTWQSFFSEPAVQRVAATSNATPVSQTAQPAAPTVTTVPPAPAGGRVNIQASELTWVSLRNGAGAPMLARVFKAGDTQSFDMLNGATLRIGNAGGLTVSLNGTPLGPIGPRGQVREVVFKNGSYKIVTTD
jgi:outer membrane biosynthesis protein TonB